MRPFLRIHFIAIFAALPILAYSHGLLAQATGDSRTGGVSEPVFKTTCSVVSAQHYVTFASNADDSMYSTTFGEPDSETSDTTRIQTALNACATGEEVKLAASGSDNAFVTGPIVIPNGVTLFADGGVTVFASVETTDYQVGTVGTGQEECGTLGPLHNGCQVLIKMGTTNGSSNGSGLEGYGIIDGRGNHFLTKNGTLKSPNQSWYTLTTQAGTGMQQNSPSLLSAVNADNLTVYKITFRNSPLFNFRYGGTNPAGTTTGVVASNLTVWGMKIISPKNYGNTDGIDPVENVKNLTITNSYISNGDDGIAISSEVANSPAQNITVSNTRTFAGSGISIGSNTSGGISNILVSNIVQSGSNYSLFQSGGFKIKSDSGIGGVVDNITFQNICQQNEIGAMRFNPQANDPNPTSPPGTTNIPSFTNVLVRNVHILANSAANSNALQLQGYLYTDPDNPSNDVKKPTGLTLDNVRVDGTVNLTSYAPQEVNITAGPGPVTSAILAATGTDVTVTNSITNPSETAYECSASDFQQLAGELYITVPGDTRDYNSTVTLPANTDHFFLSAILIPAAAEFPSPNGGVAFDEDGTRLNTTFAPIGGNGTIATIQVPAKSGTHHYTAWSASDSYYPEYNIGPYSGIYTITVTMP